MNITRHKKRKIIKSVKDPEQIAKDKLFQMSYLYDDQYIDHSNLLQTQTYHNNITMTPEMKMPPSIKQLIQKYRCKTEEVRTKPYRRQRVASLLAKQRTNNSISSFHNKSQLYICNTIESNYVFVGSKSLPQSAPVKPVHVNKACLLLLDSKARMSKQQMLSLVEQPMIKVSTAATRKQKYDLQSLFRIQKIKNYSSDSRKSKNRKLLMSTTFT